MKSTATTAKKNTNSNEDYVKMNIDDELVAVVVVVVSDPSTAAAAAVDLVNN